MCNNHVRWLWVPAFAGTTLQMTRPRHAFSWIRFSNSASSHARFRDLAACFARGLPSAWRSLQSEGAGMPGAQCARSRACSVENTRVSHHGHTGNTRHSPRNGFNGFLRALPGDRALLSPSPALLSANLTPASRRQDHTTSPSASAPLVKLRISVHRIPCRVDDVGQRPSVAGDGASQCH